MKKNESIVIRDVKLLGLSQNAEVLAEKLIDKIDMPVVFEINSQQDRNYASRHGYLHNQFWVTVKEQSEKSEYDRIILSNLYRGIQERKRILRPSISDAYKNELLKIQDEYKRKERIKICKELLGRLAALSTTVDAELYLMPYGIVTSEKTKQLQFENRKFLLNDYLKKQRGIVKLCWYPELELHNIIDYSRIAFWNDEYHKELVCLLEKTYPLSKAEWYVQKLNQMVEMLRTIYKMYEKNPEVDVISWVMKKTVSIVELQDIVNLKYKYAMKANYIFKNGKNAPVFSFVPEGIKNEESLIIAVRYINEGILLLQEFYHYIENKKIPDVHVNLIETDFREACADGNCKKGYFISITTGMIEYLEKSANILDINSLDLDKIVSIFGEDEVRNRLYRYSLYYVTAHEYAHILNRDCDSAVGEKFFDRKRKEESADEDAYKMMKKVLFMQYRPETDNILFEMQKMYVNTVADQKIFNEASKWCKNLLRYCFH